MVRCRFCGRVFISSQSVRAHLRFCRAYQRTRTHPSVQPRARSDTTEDEDLRRLFGPAVPARRTYPAPQERAPRRPAQRPAPPRDPGWSREQIRQEVRRQWEALQDEERREAAEQRSRAAQQRSVIQHLKLLVVDMFFTWEPIPPEARAEAKEQIERKLITLPILDLPLLELQQIATGVRERVFAPFRNPPPPVVVPSRSNVTQTLLPAHSTEVAMPLRKVLSGFFECPSCGEEYELDRVPEQEAVCEECHVKLEEVDDEGDGE